MKKALRMILNYLITTVVGLIIGAIIHIQYLTSANLVAGHSIEYPKSIFFYSLLENAPIVLLLIIPIILTWKIRHLDNPVASSLTFAFLAALTWLVVLPSTQILIKVLPSKTQEYLSSRNELSAGYFRDWGDKYYYFLTDEDTETASAKALLLFNKRNPHVYGDETIVETDKKSEFATNAEPFKDSLVTQTMSGVPWRIFYVFKLFESYVQRSWENGYISWLCFCSFGFLMASAYCLIQLSKWRMVNFTYAFIVQVAALGINTLYFTDAFTNTRYMISKIFYGNDFSRLQYFQNHDIQFPLVLTNLVLGVIIITIGLIITSVKRKR